MGYFYLGSLRALRTTRNLQEMALRDILLGPLEECVEKHGAHLIDLIVRGDKGKQVVEVFVDNEEGVTAELCAEISRSMIQTIDAARILPGTYRLDVSSPGIERPLKFPWQYRKHVGRPVTVNVRSESGARQEKGTLIACNPAEIVLQSAKAKVQMTIAVNEIIEFRVNSPW